MTKQIETTKDRFGTWSPRKIIALRTRLGLSQEALATEIGVHPLTVANWEAMAITPSLTARIDLDLYVKRNGV